MIKAILKLAAVVSIAAALLISIAGLAVIVWFYGTAFITWMARFLHYFIGG